MKVVDKIIFDCEVSTRKILKVPVETIVATPYNPPDRTDDGVEFRKLTETVRKYGAIQPILITSDRDLVDGNRRLAAAKLAGLKTIDCLILDDAIDKDLAFGDLNTTSKKLTNRGWLYVCRYGMKKPPAAVMSQYQELSKIVGTYGIDLLIEKKLGLKFLEFCRNIKAHGVAMRLDEIIISTAKGRLTNKLNFVIRNQELTTSEKAEKLTVLLKGAA